MAATPNIVTAFLEEPWYYLSAGFILAFTYSAISKDLAVLYFILVSVDAFAYFSLKPQLNFNSVSGNTGRAMGYAVLAFVAFIAISIFLVNLLQASANLTVASLTSRIGAATFGAATKPILENNPIAIFVLGAIMIPIIETKTLIARLMEVLSKIFKISLNLDPRTPEGRKTWFLFAVVSAFGVIFHFQAKGVGDTVALTLTFIFWMVSCFLIVKTREAESAVYLHQINNGWTLVNLLKKSFGG
ncbi:MAG: hypothetical protein HY376_03030 [Candidatus Blackburnbacteria bacterium]|nr:hypothetical protein [Candidatus Blackburnbacteria bacterium]